MRAPSSGPGQGAELNSQKSYAVIYGAGNKAGKAFAYYLMSKGFNLILIEREGDSLQALEEQLRKLLPEKNAIFVKIVLNKFDQDSINYAVQKYSTFPVKIFVNCKSSKKTGEKKIIDENTLEQRKKAILKESLMSNPNDPILKEILESEDGNHCYEISTGAEIHYTGKENIEGYASLVNIFMRTMMMTSKTPSLINIDNVDTRYNQNNQNDDGLLFYNATIDFKDNFTTSLQRKFKGLKTINVKTNYNNMPEGVVPTKIANKLCNKTFSYIGLKNTINF